MRVCCLPSRGFTLVELLIAMVIFSIVSMMAYGGLNAVLRAEEQLSQNSTRLKNIQRALFLVGEDITQLVGRQVRDSYGDSQPALFASELGLLPLEFTRSGWLNPAELKRSRLQRIGYTIEEETLVRYHWTHLDREQSIEPFRSALLQGVVSMSTRFLDKERQWQDHWPPLGDETQTALPLGVELRVELKPEGEVRRLYRLINYHW
ncbi:type II secretion system protein GspJ [Ectothiorhodospiraceae bacterium BW-2]|nr:type II secretion system protein GspJ [Ectothiorhodospiraceae bacterium BW-2]